MSNKNLKNSTLDGFLKIDLSHYKVFNSFRQNLKLWSSTHLHNTECPICLSEPKIPVRTNKCSHIFCLKCMTKWFKISKKCPYCRITFSKLYIT